MASINTAGTILKYATSVSAQVETATVVGTISTAGNASVTVTGKGIKGSPLLTSVAVALSDTATAIAGKIRTALSAVSAITDIYSVGGTGATVVLTRIVPEENDTTLNIAIANGTCAGLTAAATSANTTAGGTYAKLVDITSYPDLGGTPTKLDTTTLSDTKNKTSIMGMMESPDLSFEANYDHTAYNTLKALTGTQYFKVCFGTSGDGADGMFSWSGTSKVFASGGGVDEVRKMQIAMSVETPILSY